LPPLCCLKFSFKLTNISGRYEQNKTLYFPFTVYLYFVALVAYQASYKKVADNLEHIRFNRLISTKPHSDGPLYSSMVIGTLAVDECYIWYCNDGPERAGPSLLYQNITAHPSTTSVPIHIIRCGTIIMDARSA